MNAEQLFDKINNSETLLAYFSFPQCSVCFSLLPKVENLLKDFATVDFLYVNTREFPAVSGQYLVFAAPTVMLFSNGREVARWSRIFSVDDVRGALHALTADSQIARY
jgi:thioredoxin-like negative regulator of GroEL